MKLLLMYLVLIIAIEFNFANAVENFEEADVVIDRQKSLGGCLYEVLSDFVDSAYSLGPTLLAASIFDASITNYIFDPCYGKTIEITGLTFVAANTLYCVIKNYTLRRSSILRRSTKERRLPVVVDREGLVTLEWLPDYKKVE